MFQSLSRYLPFLHPALEPPEMRRKRAQAGALYGVLTGAVFVLSKGIVNTLLFPDLPMGVDWPALGLDGLIYGLGLTALGVWSAWPSEGWYGMSGSALGLAAVILLANLYEGQGPWAASLLILTVIWVPVAVMCLPVTWLLRWLARRHVQAILQPGPARWRGLAQVLGMALLAGALPGLFWRMSPGAERAVRAVHALVQAAATDLDSTPFRRLPNFPAHIGQPYTLSQRPSAVSMGGADVRVRFPDGYAVTCVMITIGGGEPTVRGCAEGEAAPR